MKNRIKGRYGSIYYFGYDDPSLFKEELDLENHFENDEEEDLDMDLPNERLAG